MSAVKWQPRAAESPLLGRKRTLLVSEQTLGKAPKVAGGWSRDGAVQDQIDDTVKDAVLAARARVAAGEGETHCVECGEEKYPKPAAAPCRAPEPALPASRAATSARSSPESTAGAARTASSVSVPPDRETAASFLKCAIAARPETGA